MSDFEHVLPRIVIALIMVGAASFVGFSLGKFSAGIDCRQVGGFFIAGTIYDCKPRPEAK